MSSRSECSSHRSEESIYDKVDRYRREEDEARSELDKLRAGQRRQRDEIDDLESTVTRLRRERNNTAEELQRLKDNIRHGRPPSHRTEPRKTHRGRRHSRKHGSRRSQSAPTKWHT